MSSPCPFADDMAAPIPPSPRINPHFLLVSIHQKDFLSVKRYISNFNVNSHICEESPNIFHYLLDRSTIDSELESLPIRDLRLILLLLSLGADPEKKNLKGETIRDRLLKLGYKIDRKYLVRHYSYKPYLPPSPSSEIETHFAEDIERKLFQISLPSANRDFKQLGLSVSSTYKPLNLADDDL